MIVQKQYSDRKYSGSYNIGPDDSDAVTTSRLVDLFCRQWEAATDQKQVWIIKDEGGPHESNILKLDCSKLKSVFDWEPRWNVETAIEKTVEWTKVYLDGGNIVSVMDKQIAEYLGGA